MQTSDNLVTQAQVVKTTVTTLVKIAKESKAEFYDLYEPAIYIGKEADGWYAELYVFDVKGKKSNNNHLVGRYSGIKKRGVAVQTLVKDLRDCGVIYPFNLIVDVE
jgi:hypothetical protein